MQGIGHTTRRPIESDGAHCAHSSCVANLLYKSELMIINNVYSTPMQGTQHTIRRLIETSLSDGVNRTHSRCVANLLYKFELIVLNSVYSTQRRLVNIQSEMTD